MMQSAIPTGETISGCRRLICAAAAFWLLVFGFAQIGLAQTPLSLFKNYFVTGDYVVAGWVEGSPDGSGYASGTINVPDLNQPSQNGVPATVPNGADIVATYLYWATVEGSQSSFAGQQAYFNGYSITGTVLGNPNAPTSWSLGGCSGSAQGSKTMRTYRADVRPYLPLDTNSSSPTFGALLANGSFPVRLADSGSIGNTAPNALGATLVIIYRVLSPPVPLNAIVLYDGAFAPNNTSQSISQTMTGFYQPATNPVAKLTHIVANGQPNKFQQVYLNSQSQPLPSLYGTLPPFPGIYGSWDNPTWVLSQYGYVSTTDTSETTSVVPSPSNSGCVSWGTIILSTTVQDTDGDGLLNVWENSQGYTDASSKQWVALPGASVTVKDIFVEVDYLNNLNGSAGSYLHSHKPKQAALDAVGNAFATQNINVHFDLGPGIYQSDPYVVSYPVQIPNPLPTGTLPPQAGTGGNAISEGLLLCTDGTTLCAFPGLPTIGWKGGLLFVRDSATMPNTNPPAPLGNFQPGRGQSYRYLLSGHALGTPRSFWSTYGSALAGPSLPRLFSIVNSGNTATVTLQSPMGVLKPGDCPNVQISACSDASNSRITITGALGQSNLNGTYFFSNASSSTNNTVTTTTFTITTSQVANGTYNFNNEPQLAVAYLGPRSTSGHSDFGGGGDNAMTLGLWEADDPSNCQPDPSQSLSLGQVYCSNQVGTIPVQTGTMLHELGHALTLTHGGTYYNDPNNPSLPTYESNCKPNFVSAMNYLFQVRGFVDGGFDYSGQRLPPLNEAYQSLSESSGIGLDLDGGQTAMHLTRWYAAPNALDTQLQNATGGRYATAHCDGTPLLPNEAPAVRVDGTLAPGGTFSAPLDFNNDLIVPDPIVSPGVDVNYNGMTGDSPFSGFNDWQTVNLQQIGARAGAFGFSAAAGLEDAGGGLDDAGGGLDDAGGGTEQDAETANSTASPPTGLTCSISQNNVPGCVSSSGLLIENAKSVPLTWTPPNFGQIRKYYVWKAEGSFPTLQLVMSNFSKFTNIKTLTGTPPATSYIDPNVKNNTTYTYVLTLENKQKVQSGPSKPLVVKVK